MGEGIIFVESLQSGKLMRLADFNDFFGSEFFRFFFFHVEKK